MVALSVAPGEREELESRLLDGEPESRLLKPGPTPGDGGRPGGEGRTEGGGGEEPRMEVRRLLPFGELARMVVVVGMDGEDGTA